MGFNRRLSRRARNILTFILVELGCVFCGSLGLFYVYPRVSPLIGRLADFRPMQDGYHLPDSAYAFAFEPPTDSYNQAEVMLVNDLTGSKTAIMSLGLLSDQGFTLLHHRDQIYLLLKDWLTGSAGGYVFDIWNITGPAPYRLCVNCRSQVPGRSCSYPRLVADRLEFEVGVKCDAWALPFVPGSPMQPYTVDLK